MEREDAIELNGESLKAGDPVKVLKNHDDGTREPFLRADWTFKARVTNDKGSQWIEVVGGRRATARRPAENIQRAFAVERVVPIKTRKRRGNG